MLQALVRTGCTAPRAIEIDGVAAMLTGKGRSFSRSSCKRSLGTSPVVPCTRALATRCSHGPMWLFAAVTSSLRPACFSVAASGTRKLPFRYPLKRSTFPFVLAR